MDQLEKKLQKSLQVKDDVAPLGPKGDQKESGGSKGGSKIWKKKDLKKQKQEQAQEQQGVGTSGPVTGGPPRGGPQPSQVPKQSSRQEVQPQMRQPQQMSQRPSTPQSVSTEGDQPWGQRQQQTQYPPKGQQKMQQQSYSHQSARDAPKSRPPSKAESKSAPVTERREFSPAPEVALCPYKGPGTKGKRVKCDTNYVELNLKNLVNVAYHYDIAIEPDRPKKLLRNVFEAFRLKHFPHMTMAFDGNKLAYSVGQLTLPPGGLSDEIAIEDIAMSRQKTYKVSIQETVDNQVHMILLKS